MRAALTRIRAVAGNEFKHLRRDPRALATVLILPVLQLLLFAYAISFDVKNVPTVVLDQDNTAGEPPVPPDLPIIGILRRTRVGK